MFTVIDCLNDCLFDCLFAIDCLFDCLFYVSFVTLTFLKLIFQGFRKSVFKPFSGILRNFGKKKKAVKKPPLMVEVKCVPFISHMKIIDNQISSVYKRKRIVEYMH